MLTQLTKELFCIEVENCNEHFYISGLNYLCCYKPNKRCISELPIDTKYELIGVITKDECSFDCEPYVENLHGSYADYVNGGNVLSKTCNGFDNKEDSFRSLIESKIKGKTWVNTLGLFPNAANYILGDFSGGKDKFRIDTDKWKAAEQNLLTKVVILKKK